MDYADNPAKNTRVGSTGTDGAFHSPFLTNSLHIQDKNAIDRINDGSMRELSLAYRYKPVFTPGETPDGEKYDFVMTDISANHLALVDEGGQVMRFWYMTAKEALWPIMLIRLCPPQMTTL